MRGREEEEGFLEGSEALIREIQSGQIIGLASSAALMECKWALYEKGEYAKANKLVSLIEEVVDIVPIDGEVAKETIDLKIERRTELLDSVHAVTAIMSDAVLITRDNGLRKKVEDLIVVKTPEEALKETD